MPISCIPTRRQDPCLAVPMGRDINKYNSHTHIYIYILRTVYKCYVHVHVHVHVHVYVYVYVYVYVCVQNLRSLRSWLVSSHFVTLDSKRSSAGREAQGREDAVDRLDLPRWGISRGHRLSVR